jgi:hypothetical protein
MTEVFSLTNVRLSLRLAGLPIRSELECPPSADSRLAKASKAPSASKIISDSRRSTPNQKSSLSGVRKFFSSSGSQQKHYQYRPTHNWVKDGSACRIYGSVSVKKVTGNLHITTLGHGYMSGHHTDHDRR